MILWGEERAGLGGGAWERLQSGSLESQQDLPLTGSVTFSTVSSLKRLQL